MKMKMISRQVLPDDQHHPLGNQVEALPVQVQVVAHQADPGAQAVAHQADQEVQTVAHQADLEVQTVVHLLALHHLVAPEAQAVAHLEPRVLPEAQHLLTQAVQLEERRLQSVSL